MSRKGHYDNNLPKMATSIPQRYTSLLTLQHHARLSSHGSTSHESMNRIASRLLPCPLFASCITFV
jgi:hypothetical protein